MSDKCESPKAVLTKMKLAFTHSAKNLFSITRDGFFEYENALYGQLIGKPSRSISTTLAIQKEVFILVTNFDQLQVRTISAAKEVIDESEGRLEANVVLIVHKDPNGDMNLKNWGRERGVSVLPVFYKDGLPEGQDLERILCYELYSHDPFDVTGPVSDDAHFFGRRTEAQDLARKLQLGQIRSLLGIRKIGKTSVINRIINELINYDCIAIMIDCSRDDIWSMNADQLMEAIFTSTNYAVKKSKRYVRLEHSNDNSPIHESSKELESSISEARKPVILFFDEIDYITPASPTSHEWKNEFNKFWRNLRVVYQEVVRSKGTLSIVIGGVSSKWFTVGEINGIENSVLSFIPEEYLSPLPRGASTAMIKKVGRMGGLSFTAEALNLIAQEAADMPYWIRKACSFIHRNIAIDLRPIQLDENRISPLLETFVKNEGAAITEVALQHLFGIYPELGVEFDIVANNKNETINVRSKTTLLRYGLIKGQHSAKISGSMIRDGYAMYKEYLDLLVESQTQNIEVQCSDSFDLSVGEWADEIAAISKRRNILEKKLRELALNFIKMDSLHNSSKKSAKDRILAVLPARQRESLSHMSADEVILKFCWTDLIKLYTGKEWRLFERMIGDKNTFTLNARVINDRPDAHAKNADMADFALYRRSLKYVEDLLAKLG